MRTFIYISAIALLSFNSIGISYASDVNLNEVHTYGMCLRGALGRAGNVGDKLRDGDMAAFRDLIAKIYGCEVSLTTAVPDINEFDGRTALAWVACVQRAMARTANEPNDKQLVADVHQCTGATR